MRWDKTTTNRLFFSIILWTFGLDNRIGRVGEEIVARVHGHVARLAPAGAPRVSHIPDVEAVRVDSVADQSDGVVGRTARRVIVYAYTRNSNTRKAQSKVENEWGYFIYRYCRTGSWRWRRRPRTPSPPWRPRFAARRHRTWPSWPLRWRRRSRSTTNTCTSRQIPCTWKWAQHRKHAFFFVVKESTLFSTHRIRGACHWRLCVPVVEDFKTQEFLIIEYRVRSRKKESGSYRLEANRHCCKMFRKEIRDRKRLEIIVSAWLLTIPSWPCCNRPLAPRWADTTCRISDRCVSRARKRPRKRSMNFFGLKKRSSRSWTVC